MLIEAAALAASTLLSEDLTCVAAGVLVAHGELGAASAVAGCASGIFHGSLASHGGIVLVFALAFGLVLSTRLARTEAIGHVGRRVSARLARWRRWEFWPMWIVYAPLVPWLAFLSIRYRGITTLTASNPGFPDGGVAGESKHGILRGLPSDAVIPWHCVAPGPIDERCTCAVELLHQFAWSFPIVAKPDVGERGCGVRVIRSREALEAYLAEEPGAVILQAYHEGPFEAGIFYYRFPSWTHGRILSITDKVFPVATGDGVSTLDDLVWSHPRYRLQGSLFMRRHEADRDRVLRAGERFPLARAGNHCQGTMFLDGERLRTPALEARVDAIARACPGFFIGRFDVRYRDVDAFKAGRDLAIVELNGASAESTNIYDPSWSLWRAYRQLFVQWSLVFAIGAANRQNGHMPSTVSRLGRLLFTHLVARRAPRLAD